MPISRISPPSLARTLKLGGVGLALSLVLGGVASAQATGAQATGVGRSDDAAPLLSYLAASHGGLEGKMRYVADYPRSYAAGRFFDEIVAALAAMPGDERIAMLERWAALGGVPDEVEGFSASPFAGPDVTAAFDALGADGADIATGSVAAPTR